jgi:hypothetical protein
MLNLRERCSPSRRPLKSRANAKVSDRRGLYSYPTHNPQPQKTVTLSSRKTDKRFRLTNSNPRAHLFLRPRLPSQTRTLNQTSPKQSQPQSSNKRLCLRLHLNPPDEDPFAKPTRALVRVLPSFRILQFDWPRGRDLPAAYSRSRSLW